MIRRNSILTIVIGAVLILAIYMTKDVNKAITTATQTAINREIEANIPVGQLYISIDGVEKSKAKLLINGEFAGYLDTDTKVIDIQNGNVVEIDSRGAKGDVTVTITDKSQAVLSNCNGRVVTANNNIQNLGMFTIKE